MDERASLTARVRQLTDRAAILEVGSQTLAWPAAALPQGLKEGDEVTLRLLTRELAKHEQYEQARVLLSEILGGGA